MWRDHDLFSQWNPNLRIHLSSIKYWARGIGTRGRAGRLKLPIKKWRRKYAYTPTPSTIQGRKLLICPCVKYVKKSVILLKIWTICPPPGRRSDHLHLRKPFYAYVLAISPYHVTAWLHGIFSSLRVCSCAFLNVNALGFCMNYAK